MFGFDGSCASFSKQEDVADKISLSHSNDHHRLPVHRRIHDHPGYVLEGNEEAYRQPLETDEVDHEYYAVHRELREDFAKRMREAKICVFDASLERKLIRKVF